MNDVKRRRIVRLPKVGSIVADAVDNGRDVAAACIRDSVFGETRSLGASLRYVAASCKRNVPARQSRL